MGKGRVRLDYKKDIVRAWSLLRQIDSTIPDEALDFMKNAALERLDVINGTLERDYNAVENLKIYVAAAIDTINDVEAELAITEKENEEIENGYSD